MPHRRWIMLLGGFVAGVAAGAITGAAALGWVLANPDRGKVGI